MFKCLVHRRPIGGQSLLNSSEKQQKGNNKFLREETILTLYLPEDAQGRYSQVARIENISGVHKLEDLVKKFRFPVTVQLVYGRAPATR